MRLSPHDEELSVSLPSLHAPKEHGQILAVPALDQVGALLELNRQQLHAVSISSIGKSLSDLRTLARGEILAASAEYLRAAGESVAGASPSPPAPLPGGEGRKGETPLPGGEGSKAWLVAGHQPELFHPGVWFKNFALNHLARQHGAMAINLVVDTDAAKPAILHAPAEGRLARIPYDRSSLETPYEERTVAEEDTFADLPRQMAAITARWNFEPMLPAFWREVMQQAGRTPLLGERFAAARRALERRWGVTQREVPMSRVCQTEAFAWFACAILDRLSAFHADYNQIVHNYRQAHGIRSRSHPVPDLTKDGAWLEAPFWAWRKGQTRRGKLLIHHTPDAWHMRVGSEEWPSIPRHHPDRSAETWRTLEARGYKVRSRALTTTLFARLFLADVFIHGIGGGIYDELTDRLIERFFAMPAPGFLVLSATLLLPVPRYPQAAQLTVELARQRRDLVFKPERFVHDGPEAAQLIRAKNDWIARAGTTHAERAERFQHIRAINARLLPYVMPLKEHVEAELLVQYRRAAWDVVAGRRDYAFCLYPEEMLRTFFAG
jgi:hypothetical protein